MNDTGRPRTATALLIMTAFQAVSAIGGGVGLIQDPVDNIGLPLSLLEGTPFDDYLIPGLILLVVVGMEPLVAFLGLQRGYSWAWWVALCAGIDLIGWVVVEVILLGYLPGWGLALQAVYGLLGVATIAVAVARPTRAYYKVSFATPPA